MELAEIHETAARVLLDIKAVHCNAEQPFTLTSGRRSPVYIDCRKIISYPKARRRITEMAVEMIEREGATPDIVAGGETAGIPFAAWIADAMDLPMVYVRKKPKGFGRMAQIEGDLGEGQRVLLVEDLATDGKSKLHFIDALRRADAVVSDTFVVFHYGIFPESITSLREAGVTLHGLTTWRDVLAAARAGNDFDGRTLDVVKAFLDDPDGWSERHRDAPENPPQTS